MTDALTRNRELNINALEWAASLTDYDLKRLVTTHEGQIHLHSLGSQCRDAANQEYNRRRMKARDEVLEALPCRPTILSVADPRGWRQARWTPGEWQPKLCALLEATPGVILRGPAYRVSYGAERFWALDLKYEPERHNKII